jgi:hypothetical protein
MSKKQVYFLVTVDGDLRVGDAAQQRAGVMAMRSIHADLGIIGRTTWFVNELDFKWTEIHGDVLLDLASTGETLGLHDHLDTHYAERYEDILPLVTRSRQSVAGFLANAGISIPLLAHRNGCFQQCEAAYRAAQELGYRYCSDVWPQTALHARMVQDGEMPNPWRRLDEDEGGILTDNSMIPLNGTPWRHDVHNWLDYTSTQGWFLQVPVTCAPFIEWGRVQAAVDNAGEKAFVVLDTHPYDIQDLETGEVDPGKVADFAADLRRVRDEFRVEFIRLDQVGALWPV